MPQERGRIHVGYRPARSGLYLGDVFAAWFGTSVNVTTNDTDRSDDAVQTNIANRFVSGAENSSTRAARHHFAIDFSGRNKDNTAVFALGLSGLLPLGIRLESESPRPRKKKPNL